MRVRWTSAAADDLERIYNYLQQNQPSFTLSTVREIYDVARSLKSMPARGRPGREPGTRELLIQRMPFILVYRVSEYAVEILRVWHTAQDRA